MLRSLKSRKLTIISHKTTDSQNTQHQFKPGLRLKYRFIAPAGFLAPEGRKPEEAP